MTKQDAKKFQEKPGFQMENYPEIHRNPGSPMSWAEEVESLELPSAGASK